MNPPTKKGSERKKNRRLNRLLKADAVMVPMSQHGFGATSLHEALVLPLLTDNETAFLGLWARLGEHFDGQWDEGALAAGVVQAQDPRGRWWLVRENESHLWRAAYETNFKRVLQKHKVDLEHATELAAFIERLLEQGDQDHSALRAEVAPLDMASIEPDVARKGNEQFFDVVMAALYASFRVVRKPDSRSWDFHEWKISKVDANASKEEGLTMLAQRYCAAYPFAQLEDFAWWTKIAPGKIKRAFIDAKTQWRQQDEPQEETFGLYMLPYRDMLSEGTRYYEKAWGLNVEPHPRAPGALPTVILDGQVIGHWTTQNAQVVLDEDVAHLCQEEEAALHRHKEDLSQHLLFRFTDLLPVYDIYE